MPGGAEGPGWPVGRLGGLAEWGVVRGLAWWGLGPGGGEHVGGK